MTVSSQVEDSPWSLEGTSTLTKWRQEKELEDGMSAEKIRSIVNKLLCEFFSFLISARNCAGIMENGGGGVGEEVEELTFCLAEV